VNRSGVSFGKGSTFILGPSDVLIDESVFVEELVAAR
jgi:hypothetical protein